MLFQNTDIISPEQLDRCTEKLRAGSKSFYVASRLLPARVREPASALYAFCRVADDLIDLSDASEDGLAEVRERLDAAYRGTPGENSIDAAFANVVRAFAIPRELPEALVEGFEWDASGRRYPDLPSLCAYGARVAGSVGAMCALLMGVRAPEVLVRACELGVAMQLTNIARDVGEDAAAGRLYLPEDWMREAGIDPDAWLARPDFSPALGAVVERLLAAAEHLYGRAEAGIAALPPSCRLGIGTARFVYAEIGREVERHGCDSVSRRAAVGSMRKASAVLRTLARSHWLDLSGPPLAEVRFLVEAVQNTAPPRPRRAPASDGFDPIGRIVWTMELFDKLKRREYGESLRQDGRTARVAG